MFQISNNGIIVINRGDSFTINASINIGTILEPITYTLQPGDRVYFGLMEPNQPFEFAVMRRRFTNADLDEHDNVVMKFDSDQTECLLPGVYYYMIKLARKDENGKDIVDTIIEKTKFIIVE